MVKFKTPNPPAPKESTYLMADYVELLCLFDVDKRISMNEAVTRVYRSVQSEVERKREIEEGRLTDEYIGEFKDKQKRAGEDWFRQLEYRERAFNGYYPFCLKNGLLMLESRLSDRQEMYIFLLLCSSLRVIPKDYQNNLTTDFELLCIKALEAYLPGFTIRHFGKCRAAREHYSSRLVEAIQQLADNLNERNICEPDQIGDKNTGDGGLDLVAWRHPFTEDNAPGRLICFAQCACSPLRWPDKQSQSHVINWRSRINFVHEPANFMFIPISFRDSLGAWFSKENIRASILMDRLRICSLLRDIALPTLESYQAVNEVIKYREIA